MGPLTSQDVMAIATIEELRAVEPMQLNRRLSTEEIGHILGLCDALWVHDGDPAKPHARLTSGLCSNGYINCSVALNLPRPVGEVMAEQAVRALRARYSDPVDWVVGSAYASITFSYEVARLLKARHGYTEKGTDEAGKEVQLWKRFEIPAGAVVVDAEELMTTATTAQRVLDGVNRGNPNPVNWGPLLTLVHRSDVCEFNNWPVLRACHYHIWTAKPEDCDLCRQGSRPLPPKANWAELTGTAA